MSRLFPVVTSRASATVHNRGMAACYALAAAAVWREVRAAKL